MANEEIKNKVEAPKVASVPTPAPVAKVEEVKIAETTASIMAAGDTILTKAVFKGITDDLGLMWAQIITQCTPATSGGVLNKLRASRNGVLATVADNSGSTTYDKEVDAAMTLANAMRVIEKGLLVGMKGLVSSAAQAIQTSVATATGTATTVKTQFKATMASTTAVDWSDSFRDLWRFAMKEELVVPVFDYKKAAGTWGAVTTLRKADCTIASALELRVVKCAAAADITITQIVFTTATGTVTKNYNGSTAWVVKNADEGTAVTLDSGSTKYIGITSLTCTGGTDDDQLQVWVK